MKITLRGLAFAGVTCAALCFLGCNNAAGGVDPYESSDNPSSTSPSSGSSSSRKTLKLTDIPVGYGYSAVTQQTGSGTIVYTKTALKEALKKGGLIYVNGMIDMSEGMLPSSGGGSNDALDAFVKANSDFDDYEAYQAAYASGCKVTTNDKSSSSPESDYGSVMWTLNTAYKKIIQLSPVSNTTIIGLTSESGIKGGAIVLSGVSNVVIRNLIIQDAYDPFPHHEKDDGFNAQFDDICIQDGSHDIWIDHCTLKDTLTLEHVTIGDGTDEKWQDYDGLLDMKSENTTDITVSYCRFQNHDKTMLIGSSDTEWEGCYRRVTLHHNYFLNCGQRLPMVRQTNIHIFNNFYTTDESTRVYTQQYAIGVRCNTKADVENNYFDSGINYSVSGTTSSSAQGTLYASGNVDNSKHGQKSGNFATSTTRLNTQPYSYTLDDASDLPSLIPTNAGAGAWEVEQ